VTTKPPGSRGAIIWANTLAHEFFHYWNGIRISGGIENYSTTQWFAEGFTEYYANLALLRAGIVDDRLWLDKMEKHGSMYLLFKRGAPYPSDLTLADAGKDKWKNTPVIYDGGALIAFCLDTLIRKESDNHHTLGEVLKRMDEEFGSTQKPFSTADIAVVTKASTGVDVTNFIDSYVVGKKTVNVEEYFSWAGLNASTNQYELYLRVNCDSPKSALQILRGMIGPNHNVCPAGGTAFLLRGIFHSRHASLKSKSEILGQMLS
jgi:predicted metalloprotease with PDZ domain